MGVLDNLINGKKESEAIINMVSEQGLFGKRIYFDENFFYYAYENERHRNGEIKYVKRNIEYVIVHKSHVGDTDNISYSIDGVEKSTRSIDRQVISMVYLKLQDYVREFEGNT